MPPKPKPKRARKAPPSAKSARRKLGPRTHLAAAITADTVATLRRELGLSVEKFGHLFGVDRMTVWRWEAGESTPVSTGAALLSAVLNVGPSCYPVLRRYAFTGGLGALLQSTLERA